MKVTASNWQTSAGSTYRNSHIKESPKKEKETSFGLQSKEDTDLLETAVSSVMDPDLSSAKDGSGSGFKMKSSGPSDSVGELASMLARAETVMDVQQVMSKAMRALADLKMGSLCSEGKDAKKYAQQIKRMEKLIKRIQKKLKHLGKEQRLENQRKKAEKNKEAEKEKQLREELQARRKRRRRDEQRYALKEMAEDGKSETNELVSSLSGSLSGSTPSDLSSLAGTDGMAALFGAGTDLSGMEGMSIDISV